jgi:small-conductance mechanosensitive channel
MWTRILLFNFLLIVGFSLSAQQQDSTPTNQLNVPDKVGVEPGYVTLEKDTLFEIKNGVGTYTPKERAEAISTRLKQLDKLPLVSMDSFQIMTDVYYSMILYGDMPVMSISNEDAVFQGKERSALTSDYLAIIKSKYLKTEATRSIMYWVLHILYTLLSIAGLIVIFKLINRFYRWLTRYIENYQKQIKRKRKSFWRYLAPKGPDSFFSFLLKISRIVLLAFILFLYLPLMFGFLPWTEDLVAKFYTFISGPIKAIFQSLWIFISQKLIYIVIIFFISRYILGIISYLTGEIEKEKLKIKGFHSDWARPTYNIFRILVIAFTLVFMFPYLPGSDSKAFQGVSIFLGILFSLGSTSAIANIVAGIVITYMRPFQIGDRVMINQTVGDVMEKNLLVTRLKTLKNEDVTIPNAQIINTHLTNYSKNASKLGIILHPTVTIGYDVPADTVIDLLLKAAQNTPNLTRDFKPFVMQKSLSDFYVEYELNVYTKQPGKMAYFYSELNKSILNEFNKAGVEIMSPHYTAMRDGNASTIPGEAPGPAKDPVTDVIEKVTQPGKKKKT